MNLTADQRQTLALVDAYRSALDAIAPLQKLHDSSYRKVNRKADREERQKTGKHNERLHTAVLTQMEVAINARKELEHHIMSSR